LSIEMAIQRKKERRQPMTEEREQPVTEERMRPMPEEQTRLDRWREYHPSKATLLLACLFACVAFVIVAVTTVE
jgi:hypothetical protein